MEEFGFTQPDGYETWTAVLEADGEIRGHIRLSRALGEVFGHDTKHWGEDPTGLLRLWRAGKAKAKQWGADAVILHFEPGEDPGLIDFWERRGFVKTMTIYRGEINCQPRP